MPFVREFIWDHDDDYGIDGWKPKGMPNFNASIDPLGITHDVLEHFSPTDDSLQAEMQAFGAIIYLRGETEWWGHTGAHGSPAWNMSGDLARFLRDTLWDGKTLPAPPRTKPLGEFPEEIIDDLLAHTHKTIEGEGDSEDETSRVLTLLPSAVGWMRYGYRRAAKRYHNYELHRRLELFDSCMQAVKPYARSGDYSDILRVSVDIGDYSARAEIIRYEDPHAY